MAAVSVMMRAMSPPLIVEVLRGSHIESRHEVDVAVVGRDGHRSGWGVPNRGVLARSSMKPIQASALVQSGAADAFSLSTEQLALACASHSGEPAHIEVVDAWLAQLGLDVSALECGGHYPMHGASADALIVSGAGFDARHNNCSGKHCGFLTLARHVGVSPSGYLAPNHPVQRDHVTPAIEALCGVSLAGADPAIDGCGIPLWEIPLDRLAAGWAGLSADATGVRLLEAMTAAPMLVAGSGRLCTRVIIETEGDVVVKSGAEGVYAGVVPGSGIGVAVKARDGAGRAAEAAVLWTLTDLGALEGIEPEPIRNVAGTEVGSVHVLA